jgi:hypothetical protein
VRRDGPPRPGAAARCADSLAWRAPCGTAKLRRPNRAADITRFLVAPRVKLFSCFAHFAHRGCATGVAPAEVDLSLGASRIECKGAVGKWR